MKFVIVEVARRFFTVTPAETGKSLPTGKLSKSDSAVTADDTKICPLPENLAGQAMAYPQELAQQIKNVLIANEIQTKDIVLVAEGPEFIKQEYQHAKAKESHLVSFANLELQSIVNDNADNYNLINYEYGAAYGSETETKNLNSALFAMNKLKTAEFKAAFETQNLRLYKVIPPEIAMIKGAQASIVSYDKVVVLLSISAACIRACIMENGAVIYCHSFSASPVSDIAEVVAQDRNIPIEEAVDIIRKTGFGLAEECFYPENSEKILQILDDSSSHIMRTIRMVLLGRRLEIDQIYLCDSFSLMPNVVKYLRQLGFSCEINSIADTYTTTTNVPKLTATANQNGYKAASYFTHTYLLNLGGAYQNNLLVSHSVKKKGVLSLGMIASLVFALATVIMIGFVAFSYTGLDIRAQADESQLNSPKYDEIKSLLDKESALEASIQNIENDKKLLPVVYESTESMLKTCFDQFTNNSLVLRVDSYRVSQSDNTIALQFTTKTFEDYVSLYNTVNADEFFVIKQPFTSQKNQSKDEYSYTVTLGTKSYIEAEAQKQAEAEQSAESTPEETEDLLP